MNLAEFNDNIDKFIDANNIEYFESDELKRLLNHAINEDHFVGTLQTSLNSNAMRIKRNSQSISSAVINYKTTSENMFKAAIEAGLTATKSIFLLTAGSTLATLTLMGSFFENNVRVDLSKAILFFVIGLVFAVGVSAFRYLSQGIYTYILSNPLKDKQINWGDFFKIISIIMYLFAIGFFLVGVSHFYQEIIGYTKFNDETCFEFINICIRHEEN